MDAAQWAQSKAGMAQADVAYYYTPSELAGMVDPMLITARDAASGEVTCWVADSGVGMHAASTPGTGLANLRSRLQAFYGGDARLDLLDADPHGVHAELIFQPRSNA